MLSQSIAVTGVTIAATVLFRVFETHDSDRSAIVDDLLHQAVQLKEASSSAPTKIASFELLVKAQTLVQVVRSICSDDVTNDPWRQHVAPEPSLDQRMARLRLSDPDSPTSPPHTATTTATAAEAVV